MNTNNDNEKQMVDEEIPVKDLVNYLMFLHAKEFYDAALLIKESEKGLQRPYYSFMAFSIESFLKCFAVTTIWKGNTRNVKINHHTGHGLDEIFEKLIEHEPKLAIFLESRYESQYGGNLKEDLQKNANVFIEQRYLVPRGGNVISGLQFDYELDPFGLNIKPSVYIRELENTAEFLHNTIQYLLNEYV
ncbi:hypothetical protein GNP80_15050 [Aliivibrio fischeri]|uniref:hypothetical protein n=1 Tax=Aliivibrio fischeri TaxID=668 RepID=UPI0012DAB2F4|nr:hypothetical protein [Aliivibrio fischeri]MUK93747.1 hypothetical protein [Aliivibrio fischeri]